MTNTIFKRNPGRAFPKPQSKNQKKAELVSDAVHNRAVLSGNVSPYGHNAAPEPNRVFRMSNGVFGGAESATMSEGIKKMLWRA
jgi:hypothetical protein